jgi:hypothetical protein
MSYTTSPTTSQYNTYRFTTNTSGKAGKIAAVVRPLRPWIRASAPIFLEFTLHAVLQVFKCGYRRRVVLAHGRGFARRYNDALLSFSH